MDELNARQLAQCRGERVAFQAQDLGSTEALAACLVRYICTLYLYRNKYAINIYIYIYICKYI